MKFTYKPVSVQENAFAFCRYTVAVILIIALIFQIKEFVILAFLILLFSAIFKVQKAPLILLYNYTFEKLRKSDTVLIDEKGIQFAHTIGAIFSLICIILLYSPFVLAGWIATFVLIILKSSAAFGFCGAAKFYSCMSNGGSCCRIGKKVNK